MQTYEYELAQAHIKIKKSPEIRLKRLNFSEIINKTTMFKTIGSKQKITLTQHSPGTLGLRKKQVDNKLFHRFQLVFWTDDNILRVP